MKNKLCKIAALAVSTALLLALAACGNQNEPAGQPTAADPETVFAQVQAIDGDTLTVLTATMGEGQDGAPVDEWVIDEAAGEKTYTLAENTMIVDMEGNSLAATDIQVGDMLQMDVAGEAVNNVIIVKTAAAPAE